MMTVNIIKRGDYPPESEFICSGPPWLRSAILYLGNSTEIFNDPVAEGIVRDVDKTEHIGDGVYKSPWLGIMPWERLSGGSQSLILIMLSKNPELSEIPWRFNSACWGDNCIPWLAKLSFDYDFELILGNGMGWDLEPYRDLPICAQTLAGSRLNTCLDVQKAFVRWIK